MLNYSYIYSNQTAFGEMQVSADDLERIKDKFRAMDKDGNQFIDASDMALGQQVPPSAKQFEGN